MKHLKAIVFSLVILPALGQAADLGQYNAFFFGNFDSSNSDIEGRLAVGGNATLNSYSIGLKRDLPTASTRDTLLVGGNLNWDGGGGGSVLRGDVHVGGVAHLANVGIPDGSLITGGVSASYFANAKSEYQSLSSRLASLGTSSGAAATFQWGVLSLTGTDADFNVFNVNGADLSSADTLNIVAPTSSTVVINVSGTTAQMAGMGIGLSGIDRTHVVYNFSDATSLRFDGIGVMGSILAPNADIVSGYHNFDGQVIANSFAGHGQINAYGFAGRLPGPVPEPTSLATLGLGALGLLRRRRK